MDASKNCPVCGKALPASAPAGICPECLLKAGLQTGSQAISRAGRAHRRRFEAPTPEELAPFFPQFQIAALIGQGGMGAVYRARQPSLNRTVALKIIPSQVDGDAEFANRFAREARALAQLNHPNIV